MCAEKYRPFEKPLKIRPHHGLCAAFFAGKGYSGDFTENMKRVTEHLYGNDPDIVLVSGADEICGSCPFLRDGDCVGEKAGRYDTAVLKFCEMSYGEKIPWGKFSEAVRKKIISSGKLGEVCGDCKWYYICSGVDP